MIHKPLKNSWYCSFQILNLKVTQLSKQPTIVWKVLHANNVNPSVTGTDEKPGWKFQVNDKPKAQHKHDFVYYSQYPYSTFIDYLVETRKTITESSADYCSRNKIT